MPGQREDQPTVPAKHGDCQQQTREQSEENKHKAPEHDKILPVPTQCQSNPNLHHQTDNLDTCPNKDTHHQQTLQHRLPGQYEYQPGLTLSEYFPRSAVDRIKDSDFSDGSIFIATYPKAGTTWAEEILWLIHSNGQPSSIPMEDRVLFIDNGGVWEGDTSTATTGVQSDLPPMYNTHMPASIYEKALAHGKAKFIVVMRNVKDNLVSFYHFYKMTVVAGKFTGTWEEFFELFRSRQLLYGDWLDINLGWWRLKHLDNVIVLKYEDMKRNLHGAIRDMAEFCGKTLGDDVIDRIVQQTSFQQMKANPLTNKSKLDELGVFDFSICPFMRKGQVGDWENYFTAEQNDYVHQNYIKPAEAEGLVFDYSL